MAAALPFIAMAFSAVGAISQANATANAARHNAQMAERNATIARQQAAADAETQQRMARKVIGSTRAAYGANNLTLEGSPLDVLASSAAAAERIASARCIRAKSKPWVSKAPRPWKHQP